MKEIFCTAISDLHGSYPSSLPGGDVLIIAGDCTGRDVLREWGEFFAWLKKQPYELKLLVAGNHDNFLESGFPKSQKEADELKEVQEYLGEESDFIYLCDSGITHEGINFYGTPWQPRFKGQNPRAMAFSLSTEEELEEKYKSIPEDVDVLISHGPPWGVLDQCSNGRVGSMSLYEAIVRVRPQYLITGHVHECGNSEMLLKYDMENERGYTTCYNVAHVNEYYDPVFPPRHFTIKVKDK